MEKRQHSALLRESAQGFYEAALSMVIEIEKEKNKQKGVQKLPVAAVNFSFAIELYLKLIQLCLDESRIREEKKNGTYKKGDTPKHDKGHDIQKLFEKLPDRFRNQIKNRWNFLVEKYQETSPLSRFEYHIYPKASNEGGMSDRAKEFLQFLARHSKCFELGRYLHEGNKKGHSFEVDFFQLDCFAKSLIEVKNKVCKSGVIEIKN